MRKSILALTLASFGMVSVLVAPVAAQSAPPAVMPAPTIEAAPAPSLSSTVPGPTDPDAVDPYRVVAITVGAVGGIVVANMLTAGLAGSAMAATGTGLGTLSAGTGYAVGVGQVAVSAVGAVVGGYVGSWVYGK